MNIIKKILNRTTIFILLIIINIGCLFILSNLFQKENNIDIPDYEDIPETEQIDYTLSFKKMYKVNQILIENYYSYNAIMDVINKEETYKTYNVDTLGDFKIGEVVDEGSLLGTLSGVNIESDEKGRIMNITIDDDGYHVIILNSRNFIVKAYISQYEYYSHDFDSDEYQNFFLLSDKTKIPLKYLGVDFQYGITDGQVLIEYEVEDKDCIILPGVTGALHVEFGKENVFSLKKDAFNNISEVDTKTFFTFVEVDGEEVFKTIEINALKYYQDMVIVEAVNEEITDGMQIYEIIN